MVHCTAETDETWQNIPEMGVTSPTLIYMTHTLTMSKYSTMIGVRNILSSFSHQGSGIESYNMEREFRVQYSF